MKQIPVAHPDNRLSIAQIRQYPWFAVNYTKVVDEPSTPAAAEPPGEDDDGIDAFEPIAAIVNVNMQRLVNQAAPVTSAHLSQSRCRNSVYR
jgi:hypothetical protein